jgi:cobalt-zinc-cadmium efflux system outer membrane protein
MLVFLVAPLAAVAGETPLVAPTDLGSLTLARAEALFAQHNRELQLARLAVEGAEADKISASARPNPMLSLGPSNITQRVPQGYSTNSFDRRFSSDVGVSQTFERGGKRELRMGAAEYNFQASRNDSAEVARQQRVALIGAYYDLVLAQERVRIAGENAQLYGKTIDAAQLRLKAGDIAASDVARINVDALRAQNDARAAQSEREKAQTALAYLIGAEQWARQLRAADVWPDPAVPLAAPPLATVVEGRADVAAALARVQAAEKNRDLARALRTRDVTVGAQYSHSTLDAYTNGISPNTWGLNVSIPLFLNYNYEGEIRRAEVDLQAARDNLERVKALAVGDIERARADLEAAADRARRGRDTLLKEAGRAAEAAEFAYSKGAIGVMDLLDSRRQLYAARLEAAATQTDYAQALAAWQAAVARTAQAPAAAGVVGEPAGSDKPDAAR